MASGTITGSCDNSRYTLTCEWSSTANTSANTSSVTAKVYLNGNGYTTSSSYWSCVINGTTVTSNKSADIGGKTLLGSRTWTVNHNNDGTASVSISFSYSNGLNSSGTYTTKSGSGNATVKLDTIARGSSISLDRSSATIGSDSVTVSITRNSSSYKHKVKLILGDSTYLLAENVDTSYTFTPSMSYCNKIPNATSGTATIKVETLTGTNGSWIADTTKTITLNVPSNVVPSVGISVTANNQTNGVNVAGKTTFTVKPTNASGSYSSTIKSYSITGGHLNSSSSGGATTGTLSAGDYTFVVKVTDSRGRTAQASQKVTVHAYSAPTISARAYRCNSSGTESSSGTSIAVQFSWEITNLAGNNSNAKQYFIQYKASSASSYSTSVDWTNLSSYSGSITKVLSQTFSTTTSYNIQLKVKDSFGTTTTTLNVSTISALLNIEKNGVGIGKIHENGKLDVGGTIYVTGGSIKFGGSPSANARIGYSSSSENDNGVGCTFIANGNNNWLRLNDNKTLTYGGYTVYHDGNSKGPVSGNWFSGGFPRVGGNGVMEIGKYIDFHNANDGTEDYSVRLCVDANNKNTVYLPNNDGRLYNTGNHGCKRLASGAYYMTGSQSVGLSDTVWNQAHGIVLVFSAYNPSSGQAYNFDWHTYFVPKTFFTDREGAEGYALITTFLTNPTLTNIGTKHIRVYNNRLTGDDRNTQSGSGSGISYRNNEWVLRYVYGV